MSNEENKPKIEGQEANEENALKDEPEKTTDEDDKKESKEDTSVDEKDAGKKSADEGTDGEADGDTEEETVKKPAKKRPVKADDSKNEDDDDDDKETEEDDDDEDEEAEDEKKNGLTAKKAKKTDNKKEKKEEVEIPDGKGTPFKECPRIQHFINQREPDQLKKLHIAIFGKAGKVDLLKGNLLKFNGFDYEPESDVYTKKKQTIAKLDFKHLKDICELLDLEKKGKKDDIVTRIMDFLMEPKDSGKAVPAVVPPRPKRTSAVKANNRGYAGQDSDDDDEGGRRGRAGRRAKARPSYKDETSSEDDKPKKSGRKFTDSEGEESDPEVSPSESDSDSPKKKKKATPVKGRGRGAPKKTPAAKTPKRAAPKRGKRKASESDEKSESEDEPLQKKSKKFPGDEEIKKIVKTILDGANLEEITMKTVCKQVYSKYPDHDLTHKKDLIKSTVKSLIAT